MSIVVPQANMVCPITDTAAAPSISFGGSPANNSGCGIYGDYSNVNISVGGSKIVGVSSSGLSATALSVSGSLTLNSTNSIVVLNGAGAPTNGSTGANVAGIGSLYINITNGVPYVNTGTKVSPTWTKISAT